MSLETELASVIADIGVDVKALLASVGTMGELDTTEKGNLVGALNELKGLVDGLAEGSGAISDGTTSEDTTWSSTKISTQIATAITALVDGAPGAMDTLKELADALADQDGAVSGLLTAIGQRVRFDAAQTLTAPEKVQACANMGAVSLVQLGDPTTDLSALYEAAKA